MNGKVFTYINIKKYKSWMKTQSSDYAKSPIHFVGDDARSIHVIKDDPKSENVTIQWGVGEERIVPRSVIYYANRHIHAITDKLLEYAGKSENFAGVVKFLAMEYLEGTLGLSWNSIENRNNLLSWQGCPPYVLGAVLAVGSYLNVPENVLMSDELLPAIAKILRDENEQD